MSLNGFKITPYFQELQVFAGQNDNYQAGSTQLEKYLRIPVGHSQLERVTKHYSEQLEATNSAGTLIVAQEASTQLLKTHMETSGHAYVMIDGSMLQTREGEQHNDWKEVKLGRIFSDIDQHDLDKHHTWINRSVYSAHLGKSVDFINKFEPLVDILEPLNDRLIFIGDGASWAWNWIEESYPNATQILDFYHAVEHLAKFAKVYFKNQTASKNWVNKQKVNLLNDRISVLIEGIEQLDKRTKKVEEARNKLLTYLKNNQHRMYYKTFRDRDLSIGSGAIESAHRTVLQKRLKQSGQRWTIKGAQKIIDLRLMNFNGQWHKIIDIVKKNEQEQFKKVA